MERVLLRMSRVERIAATAVADRFQLRLDAAIKQRNADLRTLLQEHGHDAVPETFELRRDEDGYVAAVAWGSDDPETETTTDA